jgi:hypothetical protein
MKKIIRLLLLFLIASQIHGQDSLSRTLAPKHQFIIHSYPSALLVGDISLGVEHVYKKRFGQEFSLNLKTLNTNVYYYNKGYRIDYFIKYYFYNGKRFRLSAGLSFEYKNIYFNNKQINYFGFKRSPQQASSLYETLLEDRKHIQYGLGVGISLNYKVYKHFFIGSDIICNFSKYEVTYDYKEIIYRKYYDPTPYEKTVPSTIVSENSRPSLSPLLRLKLSYIITKT